MRTSFGHDLEFPPFYYKIEKYSIVYIDHNFFIDSSVDGHLGCFHVLAIVNSASVNNGIHVSFSILVSEGKGTPLQYSCLENPMNGGAW